MAANVFERWSRRKRGIAAALPEPRAIPAEPDADALSEEEIAALPDIATLTAESDVTGFLRKGVPAALRNAALRRIWLADPAIRDFVGPARDYSYDWNIQGGVPGNGPLEPGAATAMLRRIFGEERKAGPVPEPRAVATKPAMKPAMADKAAAEHAGPRADPDGPQTDPRPALRNEPEGSGSCA